VTTNNFGNCSRATTDESLSATITRTENEPSSYSYGQAGLDDQLSVNQVLDRFTLALARQVAREDHERAMAEMALKRG
jgi:hypothetical protein